MKPPLRPLGHVCLFCLGIGGMTAALATAYQKPIPATRLPASPRPVTITGYADDAMEPFVTRDGRYLLFNNRNEPPANTDIHYAERVNDSTYAYRGKVVGINTPALEGCPTVDRAGRMYFVSPRDYDKSLCTIYSALFKNGAATDVRPVESISRKRPGIVNFDVDVSPDGKTLIFVDGQFKPGAGPPQSANLVLADWDGRQFVRNPNSANLLRAVNALGLEYAPTISADKRTLYFTRFDPPSGHPGPQIYRATRPTATAPFAPPTHVDGLGEFVEGSALSPDERLLYFHRKENGKFRLYAVAVR